MSISKFFSNATQFNGVSVSDKYSIAAGYGLTSISLLRSPHLYLRFAEAVNRLGKPSLAYAVVRYGLNKATLSDEAKVNPDELISEEQWLNWDDESFENNIGTAVRGRGYGLAYPEATAENLPSDLDEQQLILWVEDRIADELAAETAFEGNRFFDLVRIARHRGDNSWFADRVSKRFENPAEAHARLLNRDNWFIR